MLNKKIMQLIYRVVAFCLVLATSLLLFYNDSTLFGAESEKPNIILIFADDLGWSDVGYQGSDYHETPHLDRLASQGMVFSQAYACGANCQPSRACLNSGLYTPRHEVYAVDSTDRGPQNKMRLVPVPNVSYLEGRFQTIAEALKKEGYTTGCFGKWHLGLDGQRETFPPGQGFDVVLDKYNNSGKGAFEDPKAMTSLTKAACQFMEANREKPFYLYLSHHAIHAPHQTLPETLEKFQNKTPGKLHKNPHYAGSVYDLDRAVQTVLDKMDELNLTKKTIVIFTSDNGAIPGASQEPLRGNKGCYYEGGIREPFIAYWPGKIKAGTVCDTPITLVDLFPTFVQLASGKKPDITHLDGVSLVPLLEGAKKIDRESIFWHFPGYLDDPVIRGRDKIFRTRPTSVIRKDDWKLHLYHEEWLLDGGRDKIDSNQCVELYNMQEDIGERNDLSLINKKKRDELLDDLLAWLKQTNAKLPLVPK